jgi:Uncharacterised nucleotidyltransferase
MAAMSGVFVLLVCLCFSRPTAFRESGINLMATQPGKPSSRARAFYASVINTLIKADIPFLIGGAYALAPLTGIVRHTKDLDVFAKPADLDQALRALESAGYRTERTFPHWLAKAFDTEDEHALFVDLIYRSGNGVAEVDDGWFGNALESEVLGIPVKLIPAEESVWSKAFVMERERFDGADVAHLIQAFGPDLDWDRLLERFGPHWRVLMAHLVLFGFIFPSQRDRIPARVLHELTNRLRMEIESTAPSTPVCQGTLLSRAQYLVDLDRSELEDARLEPGGAMTTEDVALWTEAISKDGPQ